MYTGLHIFQLLDSTFLREEVYLCDTKSTWMMETQHNNNELLAHYILGEATSLR